MVGRLELLDRPSARDWPKTRCATWPAATPTKRQQAFRFLHEQGRYVEPIVRRVMKTTNDDAVRTLCRRLLLTDFVTELRAAVHNSADGKRLTIDPVLLRAHLARLLREIGCDDEARAEGEAVLAALKTYPAGSESDTCRQSGRARDPGGRRRGDRRRQKGVRDLRPPGRAPVENDGRTSIPSAITWLRDWWVGRAYARCLLRTPKADATIAELEKYLGHPSSPSTSSADDRSVSRFPGISPRWSGQAQARRSSLVGADGQAQVGGGPIAAGPDPKDPGQTRELIYPTADGCQECVK